MKKILLSIVLLTYCFHVCAQAIDTTYPAYNITASSAQLNGIVYANGVATAVTFEYGATLILNNKIAATPDTVKNIQDVNAVISGLNVNARYYYRIKAVNGGGTVLSGIDSFFTSNIYAIDSTLPATNIAAENAILNGTVNAVGADFSVVFEYGTTSSLGDSIIATPDTVYGNNITNVSAQITGLISNSLYYYRVKAINSKNVYYGDILSFYASPRILLDTTYLATGITSTGAQLNGGVVANGDTAIVTFEYGTSPSALVNMVNALPGKVNGYNWQNESAVITGLNNNTEYYYRVKAAGSTGTPYGNIQQFYTGAPEIPNWDFEVWDTTTSQVPVGWNGIGGVAMVPYNNGFAARLYPAGFLNVGAIVFGGYINDGFYGGVPVTALPDSMAGYFNYDIAPGDTAYTGLFLQRNDSLISIDADTFTGSSNGNFVRISIPLTQPVINEPDTMLLLCLSSNVFGSKHLGNPNSALTVADLSFIGGNADSIPSLAFTNWDTLSSIYLQGWPGQGEPFLGLNDIFERTTDSYSGKYALRLNNDSTYHNIFHARISNSIKVANRHVSFNGYIKWLPGDDTMSIFVQMFKQGQMIGTGQLLIIDSVPSYSPFTCNISYYDSTSIPDSCSISMTMDDQRSMHAQSVAYIDHLSFDETNFTVTGNSPQPFEETYNLANDSGNAIIPGINNGVIVCGSTNKVGAGGYDAYIMEILTDGTVVWQKQYGGSAEEYGKSVAEDSTGYVITGSTTSFSANGSSHIPLVKTDTGGNLLWTRTYSSDSSEYGFYVSATSDSGYIITGQTNASFGAGGTDLLLIKTDKNGQPQWMNTYGTPGNEAGYFVEQTPQGGYVVLGNSDSVGSTLNHILFMLTDSAGTFNNGGQLLASGNGDDEGQIILSFSGNNIILAGTTSSGSTGKDKMYILSLSTNNGISVNWAYTYGGTGTEKLSGASVTTSGGYILTGSTTSFGNSSGSNGFVVETDSNGNVLSATVIGDNGSTNISGVIPDTGINIVAGYTDSFGLSNNNDVYVTTIDDGGNLCNNSEVSITASAWTPTITGPPISNFSVQPAGFTYDTVAFVQNSYSPYTGNICSSIVPRLVVNAGSNDTVCPGTPVVIGGDPTASGGTGAYTYTWSPSTGLSSNSVANPTATVTATTTYTVHVTDQGSQVDSAKVTVVANSSLCEGIANVSDNNSISVVPNPSNGNFTINLSDLTLVNGQIHIYDFSGKVVYADKMNSTTRTEISIGGLSSGIYLIQVTDAAHNLYHKLMIN